MALSNRVIVFPYIPPSDAAFAGLCLRARPGEKAQVARKVGDWAVLEVGGRIGLYPLAYTVKVTEHKSCVNGGGRVAAAPDTLSSRKSPTAKGKDDAFEKYSERRDTVASPELGVKNDAEPSGVNIGVHTARRVTVPQDTHYSNANDTTALFTRMRHDTKSGVRVTLGGCGAVSDEEGRVGDGDCDRVSDTSRYDCHLMSSSEKNDHRPKSLVRQEGAEKRERLCSAIGSLRKQFVDLDLEVEWTNNIAARIQAIRQYLIDARNPESIPCGVQRSHPPREEQKAAEVTRPGGLDLEVLKKVIYQLQNTLLMYAKGSGATSSSVEGYSTPAEDETMGEVAALKHDECGSELEQLWHGSLGPEMKSELQSIEECIQRELETFSYYTSQRQRLQANAERLQHLKAAMDEESWLLKESEEALEEVAPAGTYKITYTSHEDSNYITDSSRNDSLMCINEEKSNSMMSDEGVEDIEVVMKEGFAWPPTLPGMLPDEREVADDYQRVIKKYEEKLSKLQKRRSEGVNEKAQIVEKLQGVLSTGDAALCALLQQLEEKKSFVVQYRNMASVLEEQLSISRKLLQRKGITCGASYRAPEQSKD